MGGFCGFGGSYWRIMTSIFGFLTGNLKNWDEAWYGEISRNMAGGKHGYLMPWWNGEYYFDKPPLYFWLTGGVMKVFGVGEWQARLVSVLAGMAAVGFLYLLGKKLFGRLTGVLAVVVFLTMGQVVTRFTEGDLDSLFIALLLGSLYYFIRSGSKRTQVITGILLGLSTLVKGYAISLFPVLLMVGMLGVRGEGLMRRRRVWFVALVSAGWWYLAGAIIYGKKFVDWYVFHPSAGNFDRWIPNLDNLYVMTILRDSGMWMVLLLIGLWGMNKTKIKINKGKEEMKVILIGVLLYFGVVHFMKERFDWYLLPIYPFIALLCALVIRKTFVMKRMVVVLIITAVAVTQICMIAERRIKDTDRSEVGVVLGKFARETWKEGERVILADGDFPAFLYYSGLKKVEVAVDGGGKKGEYWMVDTKSLRELLDERVLLVVPANFPQPKGKLTGAVRGPYGYIFAHFGN